MILLEKNSVPGSLRLVGAALLAVFAAVAASQEHLATLTICDIRTNSKKYLGKTVVVMGEVHSEHHGVHMTSPKCDLGALLVESSSLRKSQSVSVTLYRQGLGKTFFCTDDRPFVVTVRGHLETITTRGMKMYRIVADDVLRAEFGDGVSEWCAKREPPQPKIPSIPPEKTKLF